MLSPLFTASQILTVTFLNYFHIINKASIPPSLTRSIFTNGLTLPEFMLFHFILHPLQNRVPRVQVLLPLPAASRRRQIAHRVGARFCFVCPRFGRCLSWRHTVCFTRLDSLNLCQKLCLLPTVCNDSVCYIINKASCSRNIFAFLFMDLYLL